MKTAIKAIKARLEEAISLPGFSVPLFDATGCLPPYAMVWTYPATASYELAVDGAGPTSGDVYVTCVAGTGLGALLVVEEVEDALGVRGRATARIESNGVRLDVGRMRISQPVQADRNTTIEKTNRHPFYAVVAFPITIQPIGAPDVSEDGV